MNSLTAWWCWQSCRYQARRWLRHNDALALAARAMFYLNRAARNGGSHARYVYGLKNAFIEYLYASGFCTSATRQVQRLECWDCDGTGMNPWDGDVCWKCDGTGVYRTHHLYQFVFDINGRRYVWHQPENLVKFDVQLSSQDGCGEYSCKPSIGPVLNRDIASLYYVTLHEYLRQNGVRVQNGANPGSLVKCARCDWRQWVRKHDLYWLWYHRRNRIKQMLRAAREFLDTGRWVIEDEIPF